MTGSRPNQPERKRAVHTCSSLVLPALSNAPGTVLTSPRRMSHRCSENYLTLTFCSCPLWIMVLVIKDRKVTTLVLLSTKEPSALAAHCCLLLPKAQDSDFMTENANAKGHSPISLIGPVHSCDPGHHSKAIGILVLSLFSNHRKIISLF